MRNIYCFVILVLVNLNVFGQNLTPSIIGSWKMKSVSMSIGISYDCASDSVTVSENYAKALKGSPDSAFTVGLMAGLLKSFRIYNYVFNADGTCKEIKYGKLAQEGTFTEDKSKQQIIEKIKKSKQILTYQFIDNKRLILRQKDSDIEIEFMLDKEI